jgi:hypothetical protein
MKSRKQELIIVPSRDRRKTTVLGQEISVKLSSAETAADYFLFENVVAPVSRVPPHSVESDN